MVVDASLSSHRQWGVYLLSASTSDTSPSLLLVFDSQRYLFNVGEGTTRSLVARSAGFRKLDTIFATRADSNALQGLPGLLLTLAEHHGDESVTSKIKLVLPPGGTHLLSCSRFHARRNKVALKLHELTAVPPPGEATPCYSDGHITAYAFPASAGAAPRKRKRSPSPDPDSVRNGDASPAGFGGSDALQYLRSVISDMFHRPDHQPQGPRPTPAWDARNLPDPSPPPARTAMSYLCIGPVQRGKFRPDLAKAQGVQSGPAFGKLHRGERVQAKDGTWVESSSCVEPDGPRGAFMLVDCPSSAHLESLVTSSVIPAVQRERATLKLVCHLVGPGVVRDARYWQWAKSLGEDVEHVVSSPDCAHDRISFGGAWLQQLRLSMLDPFLFPIPHHALQSDVALSSVPNLPSKTSVWLADTRFELGTGAFAFRSPARDCDVPAPSPAADARAAKIYTAFGNSPLDAKLTAAGEQAWRDYVELKAVAHADVDLAAKAREGRPGRSFDDVVVTTLGTGSAAPAQYRNVSSIMVDVPDCGSLLFDAGENTLGQLRRLLGPEAARERLSSLRLVCISHMHSDHHAGLAALLQARASIADAPRLTLVAPRLVWLGLQDHHAWESLGLNNVAYVAAHTLLRPSSAPLAVLKPLKLSGLHMVDVDHRGGQCFGCVIDHVDGWRIVYSGDTRPCSRLVDAGQGADLLIHEATLDDEYADSARVKGHSTTGQALDIATRMRAKVCLLTHFSQRYPKLPHLSPALLPRVGEPAVDVVLAFDMMRLRIGDAWKFHHYLPPLAAVLREIDPRAREPSTMRTD